MCLHTDQPLRDVQLESPRRDQNFSPAEVSAAGLAAAAAAPVTTTPTFFALRSNGNLVVLLDKDRYS